MKTYTIPVSFVFKGEFYVKADSPSQALAFVDEHCGMTRHRGVHSSLPDELIDWSFSMHAEKDMPDEIF